VGGAELRQLLVLELDELARHLEVRAVPGRIDAQGFHVDALRVHLLQTIRAHDQRRVVRRGLAHHLRYAWHDAVAMDVDHLDSSSAHRHLPSSGRGARLSTGSNDLAHAAIGQQHTRNGTGRVLDERPAISHGLLLNSAGAPQDPGSVARGRF
jgi:hypothetical protein